VKDCHLAAPTKRPEADVSIKPLTHPIFRRADQQFDRNEGSIIGLTNLNQVGMTIRFDLDTAGARAAASQFHSRLTLAEKRFGNPFGQSRFTDPRGPDQEKRAA
jgi:hypothetical protein